MSWKDGRMEGWKGGRVEGWKGGTMGGWNSSGYSATQSTNDRPPIFHPSIPVGALIGWCIFDLIYLVRFSDDEAVVPGAGQPLVLKSFDLTLQAVLQLESCRVQTLKITVGDLLLMTRCTSF